MVSLDLFDIAVLMAEFTKISLVTVARYVECFAVLYFTFGISQWLLCITVNISAVLLVTAEAIGLPHLANLIRLFQFLRRCFGLVSDLLGSIWRSL